MAISPPQSASNLNNAPAKLRSVVVGAAKNGASSGNPPSAVAASQKNRGREFAESANDETKSKYVKGIYG